MDESVIPLGMYCYDDKICPYWSRNEKEDEQNNGYCSFLECGDWEHDSMGLLWDQVKECGLNDEIEEDVDYPN